jgi:BirA family biotin operon repressor/biotin-[acetyl-CoA-carboxylase] ligase
MDPLSKENLQGGLKTSLFGSKLFFFESIDSTNASAKTLAQAGSSEGTVVTAEFQTHGRGRHGRSWTATAGENLLFSVVLRPALPRASAGLLTFFAAVSVARGIEQVCGTPIEYKWPNDLLLKNRKTCGILLENSFGDRTIDYAVIGVGINVNQREFNGDLGRRATSLALEIGRPVDRIKLFSSIMTSMESAYGDVRSGDFSGLLKDWNARCTMFGHQVTVAQNDGGISGKAVGLNADGGLILETATGRRTIYAGDISLLPA